MFKELIFVITLSLVTASISFAMPTNGCGGDCTSCHSLSEKDATTLLSKIGATAKSVKQSPSKGLFEVLAEKDGKQGIVFIDYGKKHLFQGVLVSFDTLQPVSSFQQNLIQPKQATSVDVSKIPVENSLVMGNPKGSKKLYVFSEPDCPYCRSGHTELKKLAKLDRDLAIHLMFFPLDMHPNSYDKSRTLLEAMNLELMDNAFAGQDIPKPTQENSKKKLDAIIAFANANGISATPTLVMSDGRIVVGMRDASTLKKMLDGNSEIQ
ncbi:thiol:disulfide interchange protein DsbC [Trichlorobacter thiogenes]|uniref:Thiol:disulfide interchange protein DsbC n=1 Tax=Trichlorobacter thiogenes TaxID=115783 RepID=A0A1T4S594_9BACT|nr:DsbC family protein [Trichlorobacter thiogenes]SKA23393.1 thiol:disulfide interchange protein DsbC [Trichlorobacter thiogenes]